MKNKHMIKCFDECPYIVNMGTKSEKSCKEFGFNDVEIGQECFCYKEMQYLKKMLQNLNSIFYKEEEE